jgi:hypothetical protein
MITRDEARALAMNAIVKTWHDAGDEPVIIDASTREEEFGWVFLWDSKLHQTTKDFRHALGGNAPVVVEKESGSVCFLGTARSVEHQIAEYRRKKKA